MAQATRPQQDPAAQSGGTYREIPLAELATNPLNLRRRQSDADELADSIRAIGILEPLLVTPTPDHGLLIVAGHRRHAAALTAGLDRVPCIVRDLDEAQIIQAALIENGHRQNLTYLEEAEGLRRLMDLTALSIRDIATRVGRPPAYVSGRLCLLVLPDPYRSALDNATISLDAALQIADLADHPEVLDGILDDNGRIDPDELAYARKHVTTEREITRLTAEAEAKGLRLVERQPGQRHVNTLDLSPAQHGAHRRQSCHAVVLDRSFDQPRLSPICTNPARHDRPVPTPAATPAAPATPTSEPAPDNAEAGAAQHSAAATAQQQEHRRSAADHDRNRKRVAKARNTFLRNLLSKRIKRADTAVYVFGSVLTRASHVDLSQAGALLGLTPETDKYGQKDWRTAIARYAATDADQLLKAAFAVSCVWAEARINPYSRYDTNAVAYIGLLAKLGYTPDPYETEQSTSDPDTTGPASQPDPSPEPATGEAADESADTESGASTPDPHQQADAA